ncbi:MAG: 16S rRNA (guanine(527)-N(7))-methyltransferase RsmG [Porticoccaceae bacterium]
MEVQLRGGLAALGVPLDDQQINQLLNYRELLERWNRAYNLTAVTQGEEMVTRHLLDSLSVAPYLDGEAFVDVGSGAGLPGIPLAIALPEKTFTLIDANGKKTRFLFQVRTELKLANVREIHIRAESLQPISGFDGVISRAYASLSKMIETCHHLLKPGGCFYAMKGGYPSEELSRLPKGYMVLAGHPLHIPGLVGERHLIVMKSHPKEEP